MRHGSSKVAVLIGVWAGGILETLGEQAPQAPAAQARPPAFVAIYERRYSLGQHQGRV